MLPFPTWCAIWCMRRSNFMYLIHCIFFPYYRHLFFIFYFFYYYLFFDMLPYYFGSKIEVTCYVHNIFTTLSQQILSDKFLLFINKQKKNHFNGEFKLESIITIIDIPRLKIEKVSIEKPRNKGISM